MTNSNPLITWLIRQCQKPSGFIGARMIDIWNKTFNSMAAWGLSALDLKNTDTVLEMGCGGGMVINRIAAKTQAQIYGLDISPMAVRKAKKINEINIQSERVKIMESSAESMPFPNSTFDVIIAIQTHIYWSNLNSALNEAFRVMNTHGIFSVICEKDKIEYHLPEYADRQIMRSHNCTIVIIH